MRLSYESWILIGSLALTALFSPSASAQDVEPNDSCLAAQDGGALVPPAVISGSIDGPNPAPPSDVDFQRFTAAPGLVLRLTASDGARAGAFSETCFPLAVPELFQNQVDVTVPDSGAFVLAVGERFDEAFNGFSGAPNSGPYTVSIALAPPPIGSITGRLVDAVTRRPVTGTIDVRRCTSDVCTELVSLQNTEEVADGTGVFRVGNVDVFGRPILIGDFQLTALADMGQFEAVTLRFSVAAGQNLDLGNVALTPPPIVLSNIRPCTNLPAEGGTCRYSVNIRNNMPTRITGQAFSPVQTGPSNGNVGFNGARFEASALNFGTSPIRAPISIPGGGASRDATFFIRVPSSVPERTMICTEVNVGLDPNPAFNVKTSWLLFCLTKESSGYRVMSSAESRAAVEMMKAMEATPMRSAP